MMLKKIILMMTLVAITSYRIHGEDKVFVTKYLHNFSNENLICFADINGIVVTENVDVKWPIQSTVNIGPYLENGKNTIGIEIASFEALEGNLDISPDGVCKVVISRDTPDIHTEFVTLIGKGDKERKPTGKYSPNYEGEGQVYKVNESPVENTLLYRIEREFIVTGLPDWAWTKAEQFEETTENIAKLRQAYQGMWDIMNRKDEKAFKEKTTISFSEKEYADGYKQGVWYETLGLSEMLKKSAGAKPFKWEDYQFESFKGGRLVRLSDAGFSPLRLQDKDGKDIGGYSPYFSLINGELVITR